MKMFKYIGIFVAVFIIGCNTADARSGMPITDKNLKLFYDNLSRSNKDVQNSQQAMFEVKNILDGMGYDFGKTIVNYVNTLAENNGAIKENQRNTMITTIFNEYLGRFVRDPRGMISNNLISRDVAKKLIIAIYNVQKAESQKNYEDRKKSALDLYNQGVLPADMNDDQYHSELEDAKKDYEEFILNDNNQKNYLMKEIE